MDFLRRPLRHLTPLVPLSFAAALACTGTSDDDSAGSDASTSTVDSGTATTDASASTTDASASATTTAGSATSTSASSTSASASDTSTDATTDPTATTTGDPTTSTTAPDTSTTTTGPDTSTTDPDTSSGTTGGGGLGFDPLDDGVQMCSDGFAQDPVEITAAAIKGDVLFLDIAYGGGCADHEFGLCWDGAFAESDPVQTWMTLGHESNDDPCDAIVMEERQLDLTDLKQAWIDGYQQMSGTIIIHLTGWSDPIYYNF